MARKSRAVSTSNSQAAVVEDARRPLAAEEGIIRANVNREVSPSPGFVSLYANDSQIQITPWDVRIILGQISSIPSVEHQTISVTQIGEVRMSPQHAKRFALVLSRQLDLYERIIGPIPLPAEE